MWRELFYMIQEKPIMREFVNCCLSYTLAQPVDIDISLITLLVLQYLGLYQLGTWIIKSKSYFVSYFSQNQDETYHIELNA
jgi:hypothetical protein